MCLYQYPCAGDLVNENPWGLADAGCLRVPVPCVPVNGESTCACVYICVCRVSILRRNAYNAAKVPFSYRNWITCLSSTWTTMSWNPCLLIYQKVYVYFTCRYDRPSHSLWPPLELRRVSRRLRRKLTLTGASCLLQAFMLSPTHCLAQSPGSVLSTTKAPAVWGMRPSLRGFVPSCALSVS